MSRKIVLHGRKVVGGVGEGEALVTKECISGWGGIDSAKGTIIDVRHELAGQCFTGKVLCFRGAKGSSGWSGVFQSTRSMHTAPAAMIFNETTSKVCLGAVMMHCPSVTDLDGDPLTIIETGDWVRVDGDAGTVEITKKD